MPAEATAPAESAREISARDASVRAADPEHPGWDAVRRAIIAAAQLVALEVQGLRHALPTDDQRVEAANLAARVLDAMRGPLEAIVIDEAIIQAREARAYEQGMADCAARRCGPPGYLRPVDGA